MFAALPNWHPMLVHFPIACFAVAVALDIVLVARVGTAWLDRTALVSYAVATGSSLTAALTGKFAADAFEATLGTTASEAVAEHGDWAFFAVIFMVATFGVRFDAFWRDRARDRVSLTRVRLGALGLAVVAGFVLAGTASRGGELVYGYGVGVHESTP